MQLRMQVTSAQGSPGGPKLVVFRPAPSDDPDNDPNMEWTAPGGKPSAELRFYVSNMEHYDEFVEGDIHEVVVNTAAPAQASAPQKRATPSQTATPTSGATQGSTQASGATPGTSAPSSSPST